MKVLFIGGKPNGKNIKVCSNKTNDCDVFINNFVDIVNTAISFGSLAFKEKYVREFTFDLSYLKKRFVKAFLNRVLQSLYEFNKYKSVSKKEIIVRIYAPQLYANEKAELIELFNCLGYTRDLINEPSNKSTPSGFSKTVVNDFKKYKNIKIKLLDDYDIKKQGLGLIDAIGSSSSHGARLLIIEYNPSKYRKTICLVGKGVTIDTGGYSIKDFFNMYKMHMDKTGASICVGLIKYLAEHKYTNKVVAVIPLVENVISDVSAKPGDVIKAYNGQTVEIVDIDAEGRLILADALTYACRHYNPKYIMDFGTLTGWSEKIHCHTSFTYMTLNNRISKMIKNIGEQYAERSFEIPAWVEYSQYLVSDKADVKNYGFNCINSDGFMASIFLMNFIPMKYRKNWVHFDVRLGSAINSLGIADGFSTYLELLHKI